MLRYCLVFIFCFALAACQKKTPDLSSHKTANDIPFLLIHIPDAKHISIKAAWDSDWAYRSEVNQVVPYVGTKLILQGGAVGYPAAEAGEIFADLKAQAHLYPTADHVIGDLTFPRASQLKIQKLIEAHLKAPLFDPIWFQRVRDQLQKSLQEEKAKPNHAGFDAIRWAALGEHSLRAFLSLDQADMFAALDLSEIKAWHEETLTKMPQAIVIAGNVNEQEASNLVQALFSDTAASIVQSHKKTNFDFSPKRILLHMPNAKTTQLTFLTQIPATHLGGEFEDVMILKQLGQGNDGILHDAVRTNLHASYAFGAGLANYNRENRLFFMTGEVDTQSVAAVEEAIISAYEEYRANSNNNTIEDLKTRLSSHFETLFKHEASIANMALQNRLDGYPDARMSELLLEIADISPTKISKRLKDDYPAASNFILLVASPDRDSLPKACVISHPSQAQNCP